MADGEVWVINASPLILFSRIGQLDWFERMVPIVWVPDKVIQEALSGRDFDPSAVAAAEWAARHRIGDVFVPLSIRAWDIDPGESQAIAHALRLQCRAVLDDAAARRCAQSLGLAVVGSIGVVLRAKAAGLIPEARPWLLKLREAGMFADDRLVETALATVGE